MLRSMYSGISGMKNFQTKLDIIGNNIANVNTYGYKKGRVTFQSLVSQQLSAASSPTFNRGGINPKQVGLGSSMGSIDKIQTQGSLQTTGRALDVAISGDGYFIVNKGFQNFYTRAGNFYIDQNGLLVNSDGMRVLGYGVNNKGQIDKAGDLTELYISDDTIQQPLSDSVTVAGNLDINNFIDPTTGAAAGTQTKTLNFKLFDSLGVEHPSSITFDSPTAALVPNTTNEYYVQQMNITLSSTGASDVTGTVTFNEDGTVKTVNLSSDPATFTYPSGQQIDIPESGFDLTALSVRDSVGTADVIGDVALLTGYQIGNSGEISGVLSNGDVQLLGQLALAGFNNPGGLEKAGDNLYSVTNNSGDPIEAVPGDGIGILQTGMLEMSNVDLATAFTEMIVAERGFQANTRIITTSDEILQELVNLKR
ncbi:MAG TPA: flagellar basal-body rod protein FlgF [Bacillales bacterium]|nr:flagellar basal-body rod protein FlgF [Bacillales bacterium]